MDKRIDDWPRAVVAVTLLPRRYRQDGWQAGLADRTCNGPMLILVRSAPAARHAGRPRPCRPSSRSRSGQPGLAPPRLPFVSGRPSRSPRPALGAHKKAWSRRDELGGDNPSVWGATRRINVTSPPFGGRRQSSLSGHRKATRISLATIIPKTEHLSITISLLQCEATSSAAISPSEFISFVFPR